MEPIPEQPHHRGSAKHSVGEKNLHVPSLKYRWIAVRPGLPPQRKPTQYRLGPTPHYDSPPQWSLFDYSLSSSRPNTHKAIALDDPVWMSKSLRIALVTLGCGAVIQTWIYILLLINRTRFIFHSLAVITVGLEYSVALVSGIAILASAVTTSAWFVDYRKKLFTRLGHHDPHRLVELYGGCLIPIINVLWAPVYVIEVARLEGRYRQLKKFIIQWWIWWAMATCLSVITYITHHVHSAQGIANNTVLSIFAYLSSMVTVWMIGQVIDGFGGSNDLHHSHRWVLVTDLDKDTNLTNTPISVQSPGIAQGDPHSADLSI